MIKSKQYFGKISKGMLELFRKKHSKSKKNEFDPKYTIDLAAVNH